jgi:acyl-CoA reductase-like NAD-dependent aldehyde dehydrogenase
VRDPGRTADTVGLLAQASDSQVGQAVAAAHRALASWARVPATQRCALLERAATVLTDLGPSVTDLMARESGMLIQVNRTEIEVAAKVVRTNASLAPKFLQDTRHEDNESWVSVEKRPVGVIAAIIPWNAPVVLTMRKLAPALACGNTIVIKTAPTAALGLTALLQGIAQLFPAGVINLVHGGAEVGQALCTHPLVRKISFTGGGMAAQAIMRDAASTLKGVQFELGGNDPAIVLDDANLDEAVPRIVTGAFRRAGQFCFAVKRVYVPESLHARFVEMVCAEVDRLVVGHPLDAGTTMGPINNASQFQSVADLVARTEAAGTHVRHLGSRLRPEQWTQGYYLQPAVVPGADPHSEIVTREQFGPVLPIVAYKEIDEAIRLANDSELGLGSSVWSANADRALEVARSLDAGMTFINQSGASRLGQRTIPFGGVKQSGIGRENTEVGLAEYVEFHGINIHR